MPSVELNRKKGGLYRSTDRGYLLGKAIRHRLRRYRSSLLPGTLCLAASIRSYLSDGRLHAVLGGWWEYFQRGQLHEFRHGDSHALAFKSSDPDYIMVGDDGGIFESFDQAKNWRFIGNLPVTQFYKVAVDDAEPFYNIYGGTQDNGSQGGPSRTDNLHGIQNSDWRMVLDWDGHQTATEPGNPDIVYAERQEGYLTRIDM